MLECLPGPIDPGDSSPQQACSPQRVPPRPESGQWTGNPGRGPPRYHPTAVTETPLQIIRYPHPVLAASAREVDAVDDDLRNLAARMIETMYAAEGVGLAAPQVGHSIRLFVADPRDSPEPDPLVFVNPELELGGDLELFEEGCLSIPEVRVTVRRPGFTRISATDLAEVRCVEMRGDAWRCVYLASAALPGKCVLCFC